MVDALVEEALEGPQLAGEAVAGINAGNAERVSAAECGTKRDVLSDEWQRYASTSAARRSTWRARGQAMQRIG